eukprot:TRINITY_DN19089_c0_g1_i2.p1 TRINITY_DN19089_c0_g1~~TRINITY_DN19089_c0_g1_i2.p1  ORF type:complete len:700 (+),score=316.69 TRINITY_DN19089_c0_g1_i2:67-2166(+)
MADPETQSMAESYKKDGNKAFLAGRCDEAVAMFSMGLELTPGNEVLWSNRSGAYTRLGKYDLALSDAEEAITLKPDWVRGYTRKAAALEGKGDIASALELYTAALRKDPKNAVVKQSIENLTMRVAEQKEAAAREKDTDLLRAADLQKEGNEAKKAGDFDKAIALYTEALALQKIDERKAALYSNLSAVRLLLDRHDEALADAQKCIDLRPDWPRGHTRRGAVLWAMKRFDPALASYREAMLHDTTNGELMQIIHQVERERDYHNEFGSAPPAGGESATPAAPQRGAAAEDPAQRALGLKEKGNAALKALRFDEAVAFYTRGLEYAPDNHILYSNRSAAYLKLQEFEKAVADAVACIKIEPSFAKAYARKAQGIEQLSTIDAAQRKYDFKRLAGAIKAYVEAYDRDPANTEYLTKAAELEQILEEKQRADEEAALAQEEAAADAQHNPLLGAVVAVENKSETQQVAIVEDPDVLGDRKFDAGDYVGAIGYFTKAIKKDPQMPVNYMKRGICLGKVRRLQKAIRDFEKCIELHPADVEAYVQKGNTLIKLAGAEADRDPEGTSKHYADALEAFQMGKQQEAAQPGAESRFEGLLAHATNEQQGFEAVKQDRIDLNKRLNAKPQKPKGKLDWKSMSPEEVKRRKDDMKRKAEAAVFEDSYLQKQMRRGNLKEVGLAQQKKRAKKYHTTEMRGKFTYTEGGL